MTCLQILEKVSLGGVSLKGRHYLNGIHAGRMAQQVRRLATHSDIQPKFNSQIPCAMKRQLTPAACPLTCICVQWHVYPHTHTYVYLQMNF